MDGVDPMPMLLNDDFRDRSPDKVRVVVFGATGYIGRFVVKELISRGYNVVAFARERSGVGGRQNQESVRVKGEEECKELKRRQAMKLSAKSARPVRRRSSAGNHQKSSISLLLAVLLLTGLRC